MADFSRSDIEEAKKRVREMQMRANSYIGADNSARNQNVNNNADNKKQAEKQTQGSNRQAEQFFKEDKAKADKNENESGSDSNFIILMLVILLSHEGADHKLLLALLYLLL